MNAAQSAGVPRVILHSFVPPNEEKFDSARFIHVCEANDVDMVYADDFGETVFTTVPIIVAIFE